VLIIENQMLKRETALATAAIYDSMFAAEDGTIPATFQVSLIQRNKFIYYW
jgi:NADH dehydrogenase [ubiquinone] 1 alpha subcomplex assembly factor 5